MGESPSVVMEIFAYMFCATILGYIFLDSEKEAKRVRDEWSAEAYEEYMKVVDLETRGHC